MLLIIGHRGASGHRPEHTLASYQLAIEHGADFIEPDLVSTKDHVLVARHENEISGTTDVAGHPEFAERRATKVIDGNVISGWFTEDFTLAELKTLRARERLPELRPGNTAYDGKFEIPTFEEIIRLARNASRPIGLYPETKHPSYFASLGLPLEEALVDTLNRNGYRDASAPVFIQSFETDNLKRLRGSTGVRLIQLVDATGSPFDLKASSDARGYVDLVTRDGLVEIATYANGIGVHKDLLIPRGADLRLLAPTPLVEDAHRAGLAVHAWTFRAENHFLPMDYRVGDPASPSYLRTYGDLAAELERFRSVGIDGAFTDFPGIGRQVAG